MRQPNEIITSRIPREDLVGLLDTMTPIDQQRVTAQMRAVWPTDLDLELVVRFVRTTEPCLDVIVDEPLRRLSRWVIVAASCGFTLLVAGLVAAAA